MSRKIVIGENNVVTEYMSNGKPCVSYDYTTLPKSLEVGEGYVLFSLLERNGVKYFQLGIDHSADDHNEFYTHEIKGGLLEAVGWSGGYLETSFTALYVGGGELAVFIHPVDTDEPLDTPWFLYNALFNEIEFWGESTKTSRRASYAQLLRQLGWTRKQILERLKEEGPEAFTQLKAFQLGGQSYLLGENINEESVPESAVRMLSVPTLRPIPAGREPRVIEHGIFIFTEQYDDVFVLNDFKCEE